MKITLITCSALTLLFAGCADDEHPVTRTATVTTTEERVIHPTTTTTEEHIIREPAATTETHTIRSY
jgi:hypothetical protein